MFYSSPADVGVARAAQAAHGPAASTGAYENSPAVKVVACSIMGSGARCMNYSEMAALISRMSLKIDFKTASGQWQHQWQRTAHVPSMNRLPQLP